MKLRMLALRPFGGSFVILTPFCSTLTGKAALGMLVSQRRKSRCTFSASTASTFGSPLSRHG